jgi:hypothetical protein
MTSMRRCLIPVFFLVAACGEVAPPPGHPTGQLAPGPTSVSEQQSPLPPAIITGEAELVCTISAKENGRQTLTLHAGDGLAFDVVVSPIVDGTVSTKGPDQGGNYRFTSHLAAPAKGMLAGVGEIDIDELETKVTVEMQRYQQAGGPGTELSFKAADMAERGIYVEFAGRGHSARGEKFAFRVNLGKATAGSGKVMPGNSNQNAPIQAKMVMMTAPVVTSVVTTPVTTTVQRVP